jgi:hypothetical protein
MNCQVYKPAQFVYVKPSTVENDLLTKGVPQVNMSILKVSESFHAPPAYSVSHEVLASYPPEDLHVPHRMSQKYEKEYNVKAHNFMSKYQKVNEGTTKQPLESVKHHGQRMLG